MGKRATKQSEAATTTVGAVSFPIVGVGASAGGLEAFTELLKHLPADTGMGFVLVQHLDPHHESALTQLLGRATSMPVLEVTNDLPVEANHIYVIPPNTTLSIAQAILKLQRRKQTRTPTRSIDSFFESLAADQRERAIGVVLSGTASDGTLGLEAIKAEGGITFAQDESARYDSMPRSAIAAGCVDYVLSPADLAIELARIAKHPYVAKQRTEPHTTPEDDRASATADEENGTPLPSGGRGTPRTGSKQARDEADNTREERGGAKGPENGFKKILLLLYKHSGVDFSLYKSTTIQRRISRRVVLSQQVTLEDYLNVLRHDAKELDTLYSDVLISVTSFFRNPEAFDILKRSIFPKLLQERSDEPLRVWVLGCSTGQEAYSIAISFAESADTVPHARKLQIFATDLNDALLNKARVGLYAKSLANDLAPDRLRRFFVEEQGGYRVIKPLREMVVFARQNLISDPPFSRLDLISCRNLLIYFEPSLQKKAIPTFHYALKPHGFLLLGASESIGSFTDLFEPVEKKYKIYSKKAAPASPAHLPVKRNPRDGRPPSARLPASTPTSNDQARSSQDFGSELNAEREADRVMVNQFAPPGVLINSALQILQFRGPTGAFLEPPTGKASFNVLKMAREGLMLPLRAAINKAKKDRKPARKENVRVEQNGDVRTVNLEVIPLNNLREPCFLILFEDTAKADRPRSAQAHETPKNTGKGSRSAGKNESSRRVANLETELAETRDYLQSIQEQNEAANEELQASNEEVQSANEELQSINEELETSKEELESANEELTTVNEEMLSRNAELNRLYSDLANLQTSTKLAIVLLGPDLTIRRFSPQAETLFNLSAIDVGQPFTSVRQNLDLTDLDALIREVLNSVREQEREVQDKDGHWYSLRARPYLSVDNKVEGVVLVLLDVDALKRSERAVAAARDYAEAVNRTARDPLVTLSADLRVHAANDAFYRAFKTTPAQTEGRLIYELDNGQWDIPKLRELLEDILPRHSSFDDFEVIHDFREIGRRTMLLNARLLSVVAGQPASILLGIQDVTEALHFQRESRESAAKFKLLFEHSPLPKWAVEVETLRFTDVNKAAVEHYGYSREEFLGMTVQDVCAPGTRSSHTAAHGLPAHGVPEREIAQHRKKSGEIIDVELRSTEITLAGKRVWLDSVIDVTERKRAEIAQKELAHQLASELKATQQLQETSTRLIQGGNIDALYHQILDAAIVLMRSDMASMQTVDEAQDALRMLAFKGFDPAFGKIFELNRPDTKTSCSVARRVGHRVVVPDVETCDFIVGTPALEDHRRTGIRAVQSTPLVSRDGGLLGMISTHWRTPHEPMDRDLRLLDVLARQAADLIERFQSEESIKESDRHKSEFLAMLAHELRNPLAPIRNMLEIMKRADNNGDIIEQARDTMERQLGQMTRLIDDLLDVSRISRGKLDLRREQIELASVINHAVEASRPAIEAARHKLAVTLPPRPIFLNADSTRLAQVVSNLLNNACKFTERGGRIWLNIEREDEEAVIRVRDTGKGIAADKLPRIFDMFMQIDTSIERTESGLGIGLSLVKDLVEMHGGTVAAHSAGVGEGSEFVVRLPVMVEPLKPLQPDSTTSVSTPTTPRRILVVDDNQDSAATLALLLKMTGNETHTAHDGLEAVEAAENLRPDVVLLDIGLPKLNGYEACRKIREEPWGKDMVLIALTGWGQDEDRRKSLEAGFDGHLVKPVEHGALTRLLATTSSPSS